MKPWRNAAAWRRKHLPSLFLRERVPEGRLVIDGTRNLHVMDGGNLPSVLWNMSAAVLFRAAPTEFRHSLKETHQHDQD
jgi:hypothetical protein